MPESWKHYSTAYWLCITAAFSLLILDFFHDMAWTNLATFAFILIAVLIRPGGIRGPRAGA